MLCIVILYVVYTVLSKFMCAVSILYFHTLVEIDVPHVIHC